MELLYSLFFMLGEMAPYILLGFLIAGLMHSLIPSRMFGRHLSGSGWGSVIKAAAVGVPLPLCSCGVLPAAIAMKRSGASRAASTSFLIATPQTGVDSIAATWSLLGAPFAVIRPIAALVTSLFGGKAVGLTEKGESNQTEVIAETEESCVQERSLWHKFTDALRYGFVDLVDSIGSWLVIGLVIAAIITVYVPADFFAYFKAYPLLSMLLVVLIAVPMYVCATGSIPIALSLMIKGLSPGTALVFLMAGPAANFASFTLISREMGKKAAIVYISSIIVGAIAFGLAVDYLLPSEWFTPAAVAGACHHDMGMGIVPMICSIILLGLLVASFSRRFFYKGKNLSSEEVEEFCIVGMNCPHCQASVTRAIGSVEGVTEVDVNLSTGIARVLGSYNRCEIPKAVRAAGFDVKED